MADSRENPDIERNFDEPEQQEPEVEDIPEPEPEIEAPNDNKPSMKERLSERATEGIKTLKEFGTSKSGTTILLLILGVAVAFFVAYALYWIINRTINNRKGYLLPETNIPVVCTYLRELTSATNIPASGNGKRMSISFWIYINDLDKFSGTDRHVLHRGPKDATFENASPYINLDKYSNKLYVTFCCTKTDDNFKMNNIDYKNTDGSNPTSSSSTVISSISASATVAPTCPSANGVRSSKLLYDSEKLYTLFRRLHGIEIEYVPVQRWVHVSVVVNEEVNGGTITAFLDGEIVNTTNTSTEYEPIDLDNTHIKKGATAVIESVTPVLDITKVDLDRPGNIYTGGDMAGQYVGFSGMVSKITFRNFDMNAKDVYDDYLSGPIDNIASKVGMPAYGFRSPIYKIG